VPRALVTGGTGLVGSHVVERLVRDGWIVRVLVRTHSRMIETLGGECVTGDVLDGDAFARAAAGCDAIFHTAAAITPRGGWESFRRLNLDGTSHAIGAAKTAGARLVHLSSVAVYGPSGRYRKDGLKTDETTPLAPLPDGAYYARSKRESEELVLGAHAAGDIWATALRPTVIYGTRDRQFVPRMGRMLSRGFAPLIGGGGAIFSLVHAENVADGVVRAAASDAAGGRAYNLANDFEVTVRRFFELAGEGLGRRIRFVKLPLPVARGALRAVKAVTRALTGGGLSVVSSASLSLLTRDNPFSSERARADFGWAPSVRPETGVPEAFRWWREHRSSAN
jgi:nucleoside-diphosphate-sugar epimerase